MSCGITETETRIQTTGVQMIPAGLQICSWKEDIKQNYYGI